MEACTLKREVQHCEEDGSVDGKMVHACLDGISRGGSWEVDVSDRNWCMIDARRRVLNDKAV